MVNIAVIYYSATGTVHTLATEIVRGAEEAGAGVRLRRAAETAPEAAIDSNPAWRAAFNAMADIPVATHDDLRWADGVAFGSPTRFGNMASQLKSFIDTTGGLWASGELANLAATAFTSASNTHGGHESTILSMENVFHHWGAIIVPPGYTDESVFASGGNPYGTSFTANTDEPGLAPETIAAARYQGHRLATIAAKLAA